MLILFGFALNDTVNPNIGQTQFFLNHGRHPLVPEIQGMDFSQPAEADLVLSLQNNLPAARDSLLR